MPSRKRYIFAAVIVILLLVAALVFIWFTQEDKPELSSERVIREAVAKQLNKDPNELTDEDFSLFKEILIGRYGGLVPLDETGFLLIPAFELSDIKLLEKFTNLQMLDMYSINFPKSIIPKWIKLLEKYGIINSRDRFYIELTPLEDLSNLHTLSFNGTSIKNIEPLSNLINLKKLNINNTFIQDLEPIKKLKNLKQLYIRGCKNISDDQIKELQKALPNLEIIR